MCVIIIIPAGVTLPHDVVARALERNPHGWGLSTKRGDQIDVTKGSTAKSGIRAVSRSNAQYERVFHARIATSGKIDLRNCHPFDCGNAAEGKRRLLFHNGTVTLPELNPAMCDSWHLAQLVRGMVTTEDLVSGLQEFAKRQVSRFVLQVADPKFTTRYFGSGWIVRDGAIHSNASALADTFQARKGYGGLLNAVGTFSDTHFPGSKWNADKKVYEATGQEEKPPATRVTTVKGSTALPSAAGGYRYGSVWDDTDFSEECEWYKRGYSEPKRKSLLALNDEEWAAHIAAEAAEEMAAHMAIAEVTTEVSDEDAIRLLEEGKHFKEA